MRSFDFVEAMPVSFSDFFVDILDPQREAFWLFNRAVVTEKSEIH